MTIEGYVSCTPHCHPFLGVGNLYVEYTLYISLSPYYVFILYACMYVRVCHTFNVENLIDSTIYTGLINIINLN